MLWEGAKAFEMLPALRLGEHCFWLAVTFTPKHAVGGLHLAVDWDWGSKEPWYLLTTEPNCERACANYSKRFQIEEMFKDYKNDGRGFGLELTGLQHPEDPELMTDIPSMAFCTCCTLAADGKICRLGMVAQSPAGADWTSGKWMASGRISGELSWGLWTSKASWTGAGFS